jgi:hypothetical protein
MSKPVLHVTLTRSQMKRSYLVRATSKGWETSSQEDQRVHARQHTDWHRVERTVARFQREIANLRAQGWREVEEV